MVRWVDLRSMKQNPQNGDSKCLVRMHNCTQYKIVPMWISFRAHLIDYPTLVPNESLDYDTHVAHTWIFRVAEYRERGNLIKLSAIDSETLPHCSQESSMARQRYDEVKCPLCRRLCFHDANEVCGHLKGEKFVLDKLNLLQAPNISKFIYTCDVKQHKPEHARTRRDIYIVEPQLNLKELCFFAIDKYCDYPYTECSDIPESLRRELLHFMVLPNIQNDPSK